MLSKNILCLTDGSVSSKNSFDIALNEFLMPQDKVKVMSVSDFYKENLPIKFHPKTIFTEYKDLLMRKVFNYFLK